MRSPTAGAVVVLVFIATALGAAQERYVRAEETPDFNLAITTAAGERVVLQKRRDPVLEEDQEGFGKIAISPDGRAVGWLSYYSNCCTSYPVPFEVEVYSGGQRRTFDAAIAPWHWCFVDGSAKIAAVSTTVHGPQHQILELWDIATGARLDQLTWMEDENKSGAPGWARAIRDAYFKPAAQQTHHCSTKP